jgi:hypothetical protein
MKIYSKRAIGFIYMSNKADFIQTLGRLRLLNVNPLLFKVLLKFYHQINSLFFTNLFIPRNLLPVYNNLQPQSVAQMKHLDHSNKQNVEHFYTKKIVFL